MNQSIVISKISTSLIYIYPIPFKVISCFFYCSFTLLFYAEYWIFQEKEEEEILMCVSLDIHKLAYCCIVRYCWQDDGIRSNTEYNYVLIF